MDSYDTSQVIKTSPGLLATRRATRNDLLGLISVMSIIRRNRFSEGITHHPRFLARKSRETEPDKADSNTVVRQSRHSHPWSTETASVSLARRRPRIRPI